MKYKISINIDMQIYSMQQAWGKKKDERRAHSLLCISMNYEDEANVCSRLVKLYSHFNPALCHSLQRHIENIWVASLIDNIHIGHISVK